jgi:hypothetical protein
MNRSPHVVSTPENIQQPMLSGINHTNTNLSTRRVVSAEDSLLADFLLLITAKGFFDFLAVRSMFNVQHSVKL